MITNSNLVFSINKKIDRDSVLKMISEKLVEQNFASSEKKILKGFIDRENETTTGLADGIAIPHVSSSAINEAKIVIVKLKNSVDWNSLDGKLTNFVIAIAVPKSGRNEHFELLTKISAKLADPKFVDKFKNETNKNIVQILNSIQDEEEIIEVQKIKKGALNIVGVTTCVTGVAHTFMAAKALEKEGASRGYNIRIEKQGQMTKDALTQEEIEKADYVIIAKSKSIDSPERFNGKKVYETEVAEPITKAGKVFDDTLKYASIQDGNTKVGSSTTKSKSGQSSKKGKMSKIMSHMMTGISYAIPYIAFAGITLGLTTAFGFHVVDGKFIPRNDFANALNTLAGQGFTLYIPILGMFIAYSIAGRKAMAPAAILSLVLNQGIDATILKDGETAFAPFFNWANIGTTHGLWQFDHSPALGFLGAVAAGYMVGYSIQWATRYTDKIENAAFQAILPLLLIPLIFTIIPWFFMAFIGYLPLYYIGVGLNDFVTLLINNNMLWIAGAFMGAMICFDLGGPVNKMAMTIGVLMMESHPEVNGICALAVSIPPMVIFFSWILHRFSPLKMDEDDLMAAGNASLMGIFGITEGSIPFAAKDPKKWMPAFMFAGVVGGILISFTGVTDNVAMWGGPIIWAAGGFGTTINGALPIVSNWTWTLLYFIPLIIAGLSGFLMASILEFIYTKRELKKD